ncbi:hypothetical protein [Pseudomonas protegens]|uniref:hypothetical protein n=1 Tax=Pseudomonas protegens TaxID=380021 RepID=UPI003208DEA9
MSICWAISDMDWGITKDVFAVAGTIVTALGVAVAAYVGLRGLSTWRRQFKVTADHELARRLLIETYKFRDGLSAVRNPMIMVYEMHVPEEGLTGDQRVDSHQGNVRAYTARFEKLGEAKAPLRASLVEAEAVWGKEAVDKFSIMFKLERELFISIKLYLDVTNPKNDEDDRRSYRDVIKKRRDVMYEVLDDSDVFSADVQREISSIEAWLRPKMV